MATKKSAAKKAPARRPSAPPHREELVQGNDDLDLADGVAVQVRDGIGAFRPVAFDRMNPAQRAIAGEIIQAIGMQRHAMAHLDELVEEARQHGISWGSIGFCVGVSAQAARQRWGAPS